MKDKKQRTCQLIETSVPTERNTSIKTTGKLSKHKDLEIGIEKSLGINTMTIPVILSYLGQLKKGWKSTSIKFRETYQYKKLKSLSSLALLIF